jgi:hypothetical protein
MAVLLVLSKAIPAGDLPAINELFITDGVRVIFFEF